MADEGAKNPHGYSSPIPAAEFKRLRDEESQLPHFSIDEESLVRKLVVSGLTLAKAQEKARVARQIGNHIRIGDEMFCVSEAKEKFVP